MSDGLKTGEDEPSVGVGPPFVFGMRAIFLGATCDKENKKRPQSNVADIYEKLADMTVIDN